MPSDTERPHGAALTFRYDDGGTAAVVADAISQEVDEIEGDRTTATVHRTDCEIRIDIAADDLVALRAGLNTWSTLLEVAERTVEAGRSATDPT